MKHLLLSIILSLLTLAMYGQSFTADGNSWYYSSGTIIANPSTLTLEEMLANWDHLYAEDHWQIEGEEQIGNKIYKKLFYYPVLYDVKAQESWVYSAKGAYVIAIREEEGRVYALRDKYVEFYREYLHKDEDFMPYCAAADDENEVLLYDFTLNVGDTYPCVNSPIVEEVTQYTTADNISRRLLHLSDGRQILEGVGNINSMRGLICYQNEPYYIQAKYSDEWPYSTAYICVLLGHASATTIVYDPLDLTSSRTPPSSITFPISSESVHCTSEHPIYFDLSGRKVHRTSVPRTLPHGIYIKDGRKVIIK